MQLPSHAHAELQYRPEVDGLRAISVVSVLLFHANLGFPGGFVGVDVFFVISGFLVTSLIFKDLQAGTFSFAKFWERRARRILPASIVMTFVVLVAGWCMLLPTAFALLGKATIAQAVFSANIYFWKSVNYFSASAEDLPLLHTWSLAVEEQFYFVAPFLLFVLYRLKVARPRGMILTVLAAGFLLSLAASIIGVAKAPSATFYLLPTRAWELLAGSLVALLPIRFTPTNRALRESLAWAGLAGIAVAVFGYDRTTPFPGLAALLPCLGAAGFIWANGRKSSAGTEPLTGAGKLLALQPVVFVGLISYSLYLWHWPLLLFGQYWAAEPLSPASRWILVALAVLLAVLSWRLVETPFREKKLLGSRRGILGAAGAGLAAMAAAGILIYRGHGWPQRVPPEVTRFESAALGIVPVENRDAADVRRGNLTVLGRAAAGSPIDFLVWGDSHARTAQPALEQICAEFHLNGRAATHSSTTPLLGFYQPSNFGLNEKAIPFGDAILAYVKANQIPLVILICRWEGNVAGDEKFEQAFARTVTAFHEIGVRLVVMLQVPSHTVNVPKQLALDAWQQRDSVVWRTTETRHHELQARLYQLAAKLSAGDCLFLDPAPAFLEPATGRYLVAADGESLYGDSHHLTRRAARERLYPLLKRAFDQAGPATVSRAGP